MLIGIDIGGTFTDIVAISAGRILHQYKVLTTDDVLCCVLAALDKLLPDIAPSDIQRICLSTTLITNALVKNKLAATQLITMPGPGVNSNKLFPVIPIALSGYINHLGEIIAPPPELGSTQLQALGDNIAVCGKFSVRNAANEVALAKQIRKALPKVNVVLSSDLSGKLNFIRRTNTTYYAAATKSIFLEFAAKISEALSMRGITAPVSILKADAGTVDMNFAKENTAELIFTGPAASVLGIAALLKPSTSSIALDIGGTTTDISFWQNGQPVLDEHGAQIAGYNTDIDSFYLHSIALGGNSIIRLLDDHISIGPDVSRNCLCLGGDTLTVTDILVYLDKFTFGNKNAVHMYLEQTYRHITPEQLATDIFNHLLTTLTDTIADLIRKLNLKPVYTVADLTHPNIFKPTTLIGVGGAAAGIVPAAAASMNIEYIIPDFAQVANAIGAAIAKPTIAVSLQANTLTGYYTLSQSTDRYKTGHKFGAKEAKSILRNYLVSRADTLGITICEDDIEIINFEEYPVMQNYYDKGIVINITMQIKPGILSNLQ